MQEQEKKENKKHKRDLRLVIWLAFLVFGLSFWCWGKAEDKFSYSERRILASAPEISWKAIRSGKFMEEFENYSLDQFPARDAFRSLKAIISLGIFKTRDNNGIYYAQGHLSKMEYPMQEEMLDHAAQKMQYIYERYLKEQGSSCYFSIVPDKNYFLAAQNGYLAMDYEKLFSVMPGKVDFAAYLDIVPLLELEDYYRTDTHWRQEKILSVAQYLKETMKKETKEAGSSAGNDKKNAGIMSESEEIQMEYDRKLAREDFYGVYCGQSALPVEPEELYYLTSDVLEQCQVTSYDTGKAQAASLYNMEKAEGADAYEMFLEGANALLVIENPMVKEDRELLVFRDSFGSSLVPLLADAYSKITVIDIRYIQSSLLDKMIDFHGQDVLFLYSTLLLNQSMAMK